MFRLYFRCASYVGRIGRRQEVYLARGCWYTGIVSHEIGDYIYHKLPSFYIPFFSIPFLPIPFYSLLFTPFYYISLHSTQFHSILPYSTPFYSNPLHSTPFHFHCAPISSILPPCSSFPLHFSPRLVVPFHLTQFYSI